MLVTSSPADLPAKYGCRSAHAFVAGRARKVVVSQTLGVRAETHPELTRVVAAENPRKRRGKQQVRHRRARDLGEKGRDAEVLEDFHDPSMGVLASWD